MGVGGAPKFGFSQKDPGFERFRSILDDPQNLSKKYYVSSEKCSNKRTRFFFCKKKNPHIDTARNSYFKVGFIFKSPVISTKYFCSDSKLMVPITQINNVNDIVVHTKPVTPSQKLMLYNMGKIDCCGSEPSSKSDRLISRILGVLSRRFLGPSKVVLQIILELIAAGQDHLLQV